MLRATLLAAIAGYADAIGYLEFNAFAGLMTGNTIFLGIELATAKYDRAAFHGMIVAVFLAGVILARLASRAGIKAWMALSITAALLVACSFVTPVWGAIILALAMGVQNSAANRFNGIALNTVFITGNLQKLGEEIVAWVWPHHTVARQGVGIFAGVWVAYAIGACAGTLAIGAIAWPLIVPAIILPFVMMGAAHK